MKKLLAAVTSFAMSASLMTSAFASSFNVSAAGRVSAVQPNVSIGEVADVAVNKTAQADFVVTPEEVYNNHICNDKCNSIYKYNSYCRIDKRTSERCPISPIRKCINIIFHAYKRLISGYPVPARKCKIQSINKRYYHNTAKDYRC